MSGKQWFRKDSISKTRRQTRSSRREACPLRLRGFYIEHACTHASMHMAWHLQAEQSEMVLSMDMGRDAALMTWPKLLSLALTHVHVKSCMHAVILCTCIYMYVYIYIY